MVQYNKSALKKDKNALEKKIKENKESLRHGRAIAITLASFSYMANEIISHTKDPVFLEKVSPAIALFGLAATFIVIGKNIWDLDTAKADLEKITASESETPSQNTKKAVQKTYEHRCKTTVVPQTIKLR